MKLMPHSRSRLQTWCLPAMVVCLGLTLAVSSAQEDGQGSQPQKLDNEKRDNQKPNKPGNRQKPLSVGLTPATRLSKDIVEMFSPRGATILDFEEGKRLKIEAPAEVMEDIGKLLELVGHELRKQSQPLPEPATDTSYRNLEPATPLTRSLVELVAPRGAAIFAFEPGKGLIVRAPSDVFRDLDQMLLLVTKETQKQAELKRPLGLAQSGTNDQPAKPVAESAGPIMPVPSKVVDDTQMPDISGTWQYRLPIQSPPKTNEGEPTTALKTYIVRRAVDRRDGDESTADFLLEDPTAEPSHPAAITALKWSPNLRLFEPVATNKRPTPALTIELIADGKVLRVSVKPTIQPIGQQIGGTITLGKPFITDLIRKGDTDEEDQSPLKARGPSKGPVADSPQSPSTKSDQHPRGPDLPAVVVEVPSIEGVWRGQDWGVMTIEIQDTPEGSEIEADGVQFSGVYYEMQNATIRGTFVLAVSPRPGHFEGTWKEGNDRAGKLLIQVLADGQTIRGSWTTDPGSTTKSDKPESGNLEWARLGRLAPRGYVPNPPPDESLPTKGGRVKVFILKNSSAEECRQFLSGLHEDVELRVYPDKNAIGIVSPFEKRLQAVEVDIQKFEASHAKTNRLGRTPISSFQPSAALRDAPGAFELLNTLAQHEATADAIAEKVRELSNAKSDEKLRREVAYKELEAALTDALDVKFKLEKMEIQLLEQQLAQLKTQVTKRQTSSKQIVKRRARDLIDETSKWSPAAPATTDISPAGNRASPVDRRRATPPAYYLPYDVQYLPNGPQSRTNPTTPPPSAGDAKIEPSKKRPIDLPPETPPPKPAASDPAASSKAVDGV